MVDEEKITDKERVARLPRITTQSFLDEIGSIREVRYAEKKNIGFV